MSEFAGERDAAFVEGNYLGDVVEADAETFDVVDIACRHSIEFFENMLLVFFGYADAIVGYFEDCTAVASECSDGYMWLAFGVFDCVVDKVVNHVGDVELVGKEYAIDVAKVSFDGALAVLYGEFEVFDG